MLPPHALFVTKTLMFEYELPALPFDHEKFLDFDAS